MADGINLDGLIMVDKVILSLAQEIEGQISATDLLQLDPRIESSLREAITFDLFVEPDSDGNGNNVKAVPKVHDKWTDGLNLGDISDLPGLDKYITNKPTNEKSEQDLTKQTDIDEALSSTVEVSEREKILISTDENKVAQTKECGMHKTEAEIRALLVKMADNFDQSGNQDIASDIDKTLKSFSARPKAPLKKLDDDIKKNLIVFIHDADQNNTKSIKGLKELFRRLRYFNFSDTSKDLGLDKVVKEMEKTQECLDGAKKRFYEVMHGRKPSKQNLEELFKDFSEDAEEQPALDFFEEQLKKEAPDDEPELEDDEDLDEMDDEDLDEDLDEMDDEMEKELEEFLASLEDEDKEGEDL